MREEFDAFADEKPLTVAELEKTGLRRDKWGKLQTSQRNEFYWRLRAWRALTFAALWKYGNWAKTRLADAISQ